VWHTDEPAVIAVVPPQVDGEVRFFTVGSGDIVRLDPISGKKLGTTRLPRSGGGTKVIAAQGLAVVASPDELPSCP
jgi:hypothetical protein